MSEKLHYLTGIVLREEKIITSGSSGKMSGKFWTLAPVQGRKRLFYHLFLTYLEFY